MMNKRLVLSFGDLHTAQACRDAIVSHGIPRDRVVLEVIKDEAGPAQGNFAVGDGRNASGERTTDISGGDVPYPKNLQAPSDAGTCLVVFAPADEEEYHRVVRFLEDEEDLRPTGTAPFDMSKESR